MRSLIAAEIEAATADCAPYEKVKGFTLIAEEFTQENGCLTALLKLRRTVVADRYHSAIEPMYEAPEGRQT